MQFIADKVDAARYIKENNITTGVIDIGCGEPPRQWPQATDTIDYKYHESMKSDIRQHILDLNDASRLPFEDNSFNFSICSQVLEHLISPLQFLAELQRISKSGYIEVPMPLEDNLLSIDGDMYGHKWWIKLGYMNKLVISPRLRVINYVSYDSMRHMFGSSFGMRGWFESSFTLGIIWVDNIDFTFNDHDYYAF